MPNTFGTRIRTTTLLLNKPSVLLSLDQNHPKTWLPVEAIPTIVEEQIRFLEACDLDGTEYFGMQSVSPVRTSGMLNEGRDELIRSLKSALTHFPEHQLDESIRWFAPNIRLNTTHMM